MKTYLLARMPASTLLSINGALRMNCCPSGSTGALRHPSASRCFLKILTLEKTLAFHSATMRATTRTSPARPPTM